MPVDADLILDFKNHEREEAFSAFTLRAGFLANASRPPLSCFLCLTNPLVSHLFSFSLSINLTKHFRSVTDNRI